MRIHRPLCVGFAGTILMLARCGPEQRATSSQEHAQLTADTHSTIPSPDNKGDDPHARSEKWLSLLRDSTSAHVKLHAQRVVVRRPVADLSAPPTPVSRVAVEAEAMMTPGSHHVVVKDDDPAQMRDADSPALVLSFEDGQVKEKLWYPGLKQYRTQQYKAPVKWGANDTQYEHGCQVGTLLQTWLGESGIREMFAQGFDMAEVRPEQNINGVPCIEYRLDWTRDVDPVSQPGTAKEVGSYFIDADGRLRRWTTNVGIVKDGQFFEYEQVRDYEFAFDASNRWKQAEQDAGTSSTCKADAAGKV